MIGAIGMARYYALIEKASPTGAIAMTRPLLPT